MFPLISISSQVLFYLTILITLTGHAQAQCSAATCLKPHNDARAKVGVGPLTWDDTLAAYAQNYADQRAGDCSLIHSSGRYGENLAWGSGGLSCLQAVAMWVGEKLYYNYYSNSCYGPACGHYTQVVWHDTARVGCGQVQCGSGAVLIVCEYDPPGNYIGDKPY